MLYQLLGCETVKGELRCKMNLWSNYTLPVNRYLRFVFMIAECK